MKDSLHLLLADEARSLRVAGSLAIMGASGGPLTTKSPGGALAPFDRLDVAGVAPSEKLARPYEQSTWIQRAIALKAGEITSVPVKVYEGDQEFSTPEFDAWFAKPFLGPGAQRIALHEGRRMVAGWFDLEGEYFILLGDDWLVPFPSLRAASLSPPVIARPDRMRHIIRGGELIGWEFCDGAGRRHPLLPEQVIQRKAWNPYDDFRGLAPVKALLNAAEADYLAGLYVRNLMRNNGDQGVYVIAKGGVPSDPQREQIVQQLRDKRRASLRGEFRPVFLTGDIAIEDAKAQAPNADLNQARLTSRHEVFIGLGVPASMADIKAAYSIGSASDRYQLVTGTCIALAAVIDEPLGDIASRRTGKTLTAEADWSQHQVMREARNELLKSADGLWAKGMPMSEVNEFLDLGMQPFPGWDVGYLPFGVVPVSADGSLEPEANPSTDPSLTETAQSDPIALALLARRRIHCRKVESSRPDDFAEFACACHGIPGVAVKDRDPRKLAQWRTLIAKRREIVRGFEAKVNRALFEARAETLKKIAAHYRPQKSVQATQRAGAAADFIFDLVKFQEGFFASMRKQSGNALNTAGEQLMREIGRDDAFSFPPEAVLEYARRRENKLSGATETIHGRIKQELEEGITNGDTTEELAKRIRDAFNGISKERSRTIALTETSAAYGEGRDEAMREAGVPKKAWLTSGNDNVRPTHLEAGREYSEENAIPIDEPFIVGGEALMYPGDDSGSPEEVINCHCISLAVVDAPKE